MTAFRCGELEYTSAQQCLRMCTARHTCRNCTNDSSRVNFHEVAFTYAPAFRTVWGGRWVPPYVLYGGLGPLLRDSSPRPYFSSFVVELLMGNPGVAQRELARRLKWLGWCRAPCSAFLFCSLACRLVSSRRTMPRLCLPCHHNASESL